MPKPDPDAELALHTLGQGIRQGFAQKHPVSERSLATVRDAVRAEYEREQDALKEQPSAPDVDKLPHRRPDEPEPGA
jgi:hypothetical protein